MITFKQFLKQKKLYNVGTENEFTELYNSDMSVIDPDLGNADDSEKSEDVSVEPEESNADSDVDSDEITEDGEGATPVATADSSVGGTTTSDIAGVPFGLSKNPENKEEIGLIARMDAYL